MTTDLTIIGGGILGLWAARFAADAGLSVVLVDKNTCGSGGSNGVLGALLPHLPNASNEKKRFQLQALVELEELVAALEAETGLGVGYKRVGRLMPIRLEGFRKRVARCVREAPENWRIGNNRQTEDRRFSFEHLNRAPGNGWINDSLAPLGLAFDNLSARVAPRLLTTALKKSLQNRRVNILEGFEFGRFDEQTGEVQSLDGKHHFRSRNLLLAAGHHTYGLLEPLTACRLGHGVKGHSALFEKAGFEDQPILYDNGAYVVPHANGTIAVGSTAEEEWRSEHDVDKTQCAPFLERALELCPPLREARLSGLWAGVRPRSFAKDPMAGRLADDRPVFVLTGGFKISFGIAHRLARAVIEQVAEQKSTVRLPPSHELAYHLEEAARDNREIR